MQQPTVLVIDSNSAVQAITALALNQTECRVEALTDGSAAHTKVKELNPAIILCARDLIGFDPFEFCRSCKKENPNLAFILLAPSEGAKATAEKATQVGCDEVIYKPFKSNRLREVVQNLLTNQKPSTQRMNLAFLHIADRFRSRLLQRYLERCGYQVIELDISRLEEIKESAQITIYDQHFSEITSVLKEKNLGKLIFFQNPNLPEKARKVSTGAFELLAPITESHLESLVGAVTKRPSRDTNEQQVTHPRFDPTRARYAAKLCALLFENLLLSQDFEAHSLEEKANFIRNEVLRLGRSL